MPRAQHRRFVSNPLRDPTFVAAATLYLGLVAAWSYGVAAHSAVYGESSLLLAVAAFVLGVVTGRWEAVVVPALMPLVAAGAGRGTDPDNDISIAGWLLAS